MQSPPTVGILGGGQLGRMLVESANRLNMPVSILDVPNSPAKQIAAHDRHVVGSFADQKAVLELVSKCDVLTAEIEHIDTHALEIAEKAQAGKGRKVAIEPNWRSIRVIQDKLEQHEHLLKADVPVAEFVAVKKHVEDLEAVGERFGYPFMLKSRTHSYDGRGNYAVKSKNDIPAALEHLKHRPLYAEHWAKFKMEIAVMVVKTEDNVISYPTVETVQENSICKLVYAPARNVSDLVNEQAQALARKAVSSFKGKGVFGVEMFLLEDDNMIVCELASRVHNSGHYTIEGCGLSQFDAHLRAILDLPIPLPSLQLRSPTIMLNVLGGPEPDSHLKVAEKALSVPNASIHLYGKGPGRLGRKMGHITITAPTMSQAEEWLAPLLVPPSEAAMSILYRSPAPDRPTPPIAVIMGSDSDLKTLLPGLRLLRDTFGIDPEVDITSAHRTPVYMASYAADAAARGIKVLIAAAGGAAHLPGMAAAHTSLPVVGVPVKGSSLDGVDSLYSIVQMPRGVPVATVGINNSINAALLAVRVLGTSDPGVSKKVKEYAEYARDENMEVKGARMREVGWDKYFDHSA